MDQYSSIRDVIQHIVEHKLESKSLEEVAASMGMSPGYLQKLFTKWVGISPKQFGRYLSLEYAKELLRENQNSLQATIGTGLSSGGRLHDLFVDIEAMTPGEYQHGGAGLAIHYSAIDTPFGTAVVASTERGITNILFADSKDEAVRDLLRRWPVAEVIEKQESAHAEIENYFAGITPTSKIKVHLVGTNFQVKVWEALLSIPEGRITNYGEIAKKVGTPRDSRAVGAAVGENPIGYLIPCHRVLKSTGEISGYRWDVERKRAMLAYEALKTTTSSNE